MAGGWVAERRKMAAQRALGVAGPIPVRIEWYPVYASATFVQGDFLVLQGTTTGVTIAAAAGNNFTTPTSQTTAIVGRAEAPSSIQTADATSVQCTWVPVTVASPDVWFQIPLYSATAANAVGLLAEIGRDYGGRQVTANYPAVNIDTVVSATTNPTTGIFRIMSIDSADNPGWATSATGTAYAAGTTQFCNVYASVTAPACLLSGARMVAY